MQTLFFATAICGAAYFLLSHRRVDLFSVDLRPASVVALYLLPALNIRLRPKLFAELRPGSRVASTVMRAPRPASVAIAIV